MNLIDVFEFLNRPFIVTLSSVILGGYLLNLVSTSMVRKNAIRDKAIDFLVKAGEDINQVSSRLFGYLRREETKPGESKIAREKILELIASRMGVKILSEAYLAQKDFFAKYQLILWELYGIREAIVSVSTEEKDAGIENIIAKVRHHQKVLAETWPMKEEEIVPEGAPPFDDIFIWTQMTVNRASSLLSAGLKSVLR